MSHRLFLNIALLKAFLATSFDCNLVTWPGKKTYYKRWEVISGKSGCYKGNEADFFA